MTWKQKTGEFEEKTGEFEEKTGNRGIRRENGKQGNNKRRDNPQGEGER